MNKKQFKTAIENITYDFRRSTEEAYKQREIASKSYGYEPQMIKERYYTEIATACSELIKETRTLEKLLSDK